MYQIYKITNLINNKVYIGSSIDVKRRWRNHKETSINPNAIGYNYPLMIAFRKYGIDNFNFEIIKTVNNKEEMILEEHNYIIKENCIYPNGYNQTDRTDSPMFDKNISEKMAQTKRKKYGKKVCEIDINNNIIQQWNSIVEASEQTGLDRFKISCVCNGKRLTTGNRIFRFIDEFNNIIEPNYDTTTKSNRITENSKKVIQLNDKNEILNIYDSIALASKDNNCDSSGITKVCRGKRKTCGGYKWQY